ncbi:hypothetical protein [Rhodopseudomonas palustris]|uniref:Uncharacterized protein n=1 Tax=Rhodopseudomonas palustris (strain BisB18) TaxID=316056 RepID=Q21AA0_RHOPB
MDSEQRHNVPVRGDERSPVEATDDATVAAPPSPALDEEPPAPGQWLGTSSSTLNAIERLNAAIDEETERLEIRVSVDLEESSRRKNHGLLELTRAMRLAQGAAVDPRVVPHLARLRASLVRNQAALQIHLDAVRQVSAIIARSIQEVESDGTYSAAGSRRCK